MSSSAREDETRESTSRAVSDESIQLLVSHIWKISINEGRKVAILKVLQFRLEFIVSEKCLSLDWTSKSFYLQMQ